MEDDYDKLKVPELKKLLKDRGISSTGATRKAQYIEKLREHDDKNTGDSAHATEEQDAFGEVNDTDVNDTDATMTEGPAQAAEVPRSRPPPSPTSSATLPGEESLAQKSAAPKPMSITSASVTESTSLPTTELEPTPAAHPQLSLAQKQAPLASTEAVAPEDSTVNIIEAVVPGESDSVEQPVTAGAEAVAQSSHASTPVPTDEAIDESRKRKRRSLTPPVNADEVALKRHKQQDVADSNVSFTEAPPLDATEEIKNADDDADAVATNSIAPAGDKKAEDIEIHPQPSDTISPRSRNLSSGTSKDIRHKALFQIEPSEASKPVNETTGDDLLDIPTPEAAIHPETRALYVRDFMRPLQPATLRKHLVEIAAPAGSVLDVDVVEHFHLDQMRTHIFVLFNSVEAAVRARSALHDRVWPQETGRKKLWADFFPAEKAKDWTDQETSDDGGGRTGGRRWALDYKKQEDGSVEVALVDMASNPVSSRQSSNLAIKGLAGPSGDIPTGPRNMNTDPRDVSRPNEQASFKKLDELFRSTEVKPKVYFQSVSAEIAAARLAEFASQTSQDWTEKKWDDNDLYRFSFEENTKLVHSGPHFSGNRIRAREERITGVRSNPAPGTYRGGAYRGGNRGGYRGGYRGGHRGRYYDRD